MAQTEQLVDTLKQELRKKRITYKHIAEKLALSEASVKRMFASYQFSLDRIEAISAMVSWDWIDLAEAVKRREQKRDQLTNEQEREIANDIELLLVAVSVINGYTFQDLLDQYDLSEAQCIQKLAKLDRIDLIELLPGNRIKLKISTNFRWDPNGPIQGYFLDSVVHKFFDTRFAKDQEKLVVINALLSDASHIDIQKKMDKLASDVSNAMRKDRDLPMASKKGNTLVVAFRNWRFAPFVELTKNKER